MGLRVKIEVGGNLDGVLGDGLTAVYMDDMKVVGNGRFRHPLPKLNIPRHPVSKRLL